MKTDDIINENEAEEAVTNDGELTDDEAEAAAGGVININYTERRIPRILSGFACPTCDFTCDLAYFKGSNGRCPKCKEKLITKYLD